MTSTNGSLIKSQVVGRYTTVPGIHVGIVRVTPAIASEWLAANTHNREVRPTTLRVLQAAAERGELRLNGESVIFSDTGILLDGQYRLSVIVLSGVTVDLVVVWGIPEDAQTTMDAGLRRTGADELRWNGIDHAADLAACLTQLWNYQTNGVLGSTGGGGGLSAPTRTEILEMARAHPNVALSLPVGHRLKGLIRQRGLTSALHYVLSEIDRDKAEEFFSRLADGQNLNSGDAILTLRETLLRDWSARLRMTPRRRAAIVIRAWNAFRTGEPMAKFVWTAVDHAFPVPE